METDETIKKGFLRLERYAQNIPGGFHCCAEDPEKGYPFIYISDRFLEILGWGRAEFAARFDNRYTALVHPDDLATGLRYRNAENSATYAKNGDNIFRLLGKNGYRWVTNAANQVEWYGKGYIVGTITDITPYMELREKLEQQNRTQREALETVAKAIRSCIRETDLLIRYGGDEFLLVLPGIPADYFKVKLEQIRTAVQQTVVPGYPHFRLSLSIGGALQTLADPMENVVRRADFAGAAGYQYAGHGRL